MVRKKKANPLGDLYRLASIVPWWAGAIAAIVAYLVLHSFAIADVAVAKDISEFGHSAVQAVIKGFAFIGQFVVPAIFLAGAAASGLAQFKRERLSRADKWVDHGKPPTVRFDAPPGKPASASAIDQHSADVYPMGISDDNNIVPARSIDASRWSLKLLGTLEWKRFELVCAALFERLGFSTITTTKGADGGIDIHLFKSSYDQAVSIVQCKAWTTSSKVGVRYISELHGVMASEKVVEGIFATTATFTEDAKEYAKANHIDLLDGKAILNSITSLDDGRQASLLRLATEGDYTTPTCSSCGIKMTKRNASTAKPFWGCVNFPRCRSIINIAKS